MPANRRSQSQPHASRPASGAGPEADGASHDAEAIDADATSVDAVASEAGATDATEAAPMNRAERRAKGKVKDQPHLSVGKINPRGAVGGHAQRSYTTRRSGGGGR